MRNNFGIGTGLAQNAEKKEEGHGRDRARKKRPFSSLGGGARSQIWGEVDHRPRLQRLSCRNVRTQRSKVAGGTMGLRTTRGKERGDGRSFLNILKPDKIDRICKKIMRGMGGSGVTAKKRKRLAIYALVRVRLGPGGREEGPVPVKGGGANSQAGVENHPLKKAGRRERGENLQDPVGRFRPETKPWWKGLKKGLQPAWKRKGGFSVKRSW